MLALPATEWPRDARPAYRPYRAFVSAVRKLTPSFVRITLTGPDFAVFGTAGLDQRIKIVFPISDPAGSSNNGFDHLGLDHPEVIEDGGWYERWRSVPDELRNPFRTYTIRAIRPEQREIDVDFVLHEPAGPAIRWAGTAQVGDELLVIGPDNRSIDWRIGLDWKPGEAHRVLLVGDETAAPAICAILESLDSSVSATAFIEIPEPADELPIDAHSGCRITWLPRRHDNGEVAERGSALETAVRDWVAANPDALSAAVAPRPQELDETDAETGLLWDSPDEIAIPEEQQGSAFYAWIAGETATVKTLRRFLVRESGLDRSRIAFMGYWRIGRAELA